MSANGGGIAGGGGVGVKRTESSGSTNSNGSNGGSPHQPTWRYWGEERSDGAVYTVYLKKVRYFNPNKAINNDSDDEIAHLEWETIRVRMIKAGTLERLVESLATDSGELESSYVNVFLATYRTFASTEQVLALLLDRYRKCSSTTVDQDDDRRQQHEQQQSSDGDGASNRSQSVDQLRRTLRLLLSVWLDAYPEDFRDPPDYSCLRQMLDFARNCVADNELELRLRHRLDKFVKEDESRTVIISDVDAEDMKCKSPPSPSTRSTSSSSSATTTVTTNSKCCTSPRNFLECSADVVADQLTYIDAELFKRVSPHHCLGSVWSRRDRTKSGGLVKGPLTSSVVVTIDQFNAVSYRVISTVLVADDGDALASSCKRARVVVKWIEVAQRLRVLKNFSSLKAIISGLQSNPVYRLRKTWLAVPRDKVELFDELARIFCEDNNQMTCRELLMKEGTAKVAANVGENDRHLLKAIQRQFTANGGTNTVQGTVPYLGTFLTDLTMIDTAIPDIVDGGLVNFDKKRKEFEVLAQIKLLQLAANAYHITPDPAFRRWFDGLPVLDDNESYDLSCQMEPQPSASTPTQKKGGGGGGGTTPTRNGVLGHRKTASIASTSSSSASSSQFFDANSSGSGDSTSSPVCHDGQLLTLLTRSDERRKMSTSSSSSSLPSLDHCSLGSFAVNSTACTSISSSSSSAATATAATAAATCSPFKTPDFYVIRVSAETDSTRTETDGVILYKSIMLTNSEHTPSVIRNAMLKHGLTGDVDDYRLVQVLPHGGEIALPANANVYYAVNTAYDLNFVLRRRRRRRNRDVDGGQSTTSEEVATSTVADEVCRPCATDSPTPPPRTTTTTTTTTMTVKSGTSPVKAHKAVKKKISLSV